MRVLRMPDERKMRVQNESEGTRHSQRFTASFRAKSRKPDAMTCGYAAGSLEYARFTRDDTSKRPAKVLEAVQPLFDQVKTRSITEPNSAIVAEGSARDDGDVGFAQQTIGEILRR